MPQRKSSAATTDPIRAAIGRNFQALRKEAGATAEECADHMKTMGQKWAAPRIHELEAGRKAVGLQDLVLLAELLSEKLERPVVIGELMHGMENLPLGNGWELDGHAFASYFKGQPVEEFRGVLRFPDAPQLVEKLAVFADRWGKDADRLSQKYGRWEQPGVDAPDQLRSTDLEKRAAKNLGIKPIELRAASVSLWTRSYQEEHDRRVSKEMSAAEKGHVSRKMLAELKGRTDPPKSEGYGYGHD